MSLAARREIVRICRSLYERGLIAGAEGNVSLRLGRDRVLITPRGLAKGALSGDDLVEVGSDGFTRRGGTRAPSSEAAVHLRLYHEREDIGGIVHAHPPVATGFAAAGVPIPGDVLPEVTMGLGPVALVAYARPGTDELANRTGRVARDHDVFLLANHGAVTVGPDVTVAHQRMESLEHAARILLVARMLGGPSPLSAAEADALAAERRREPVAADRPSRGAESRRRSR